MRLMTKAGIVLFVLYIAFVGGIAFWMERSVKSVSRSVLKNTARLLGNDIAAVISKSAIEELRLSDPESRERLEETIEDITSRSEVVSSVSVVDATGKVVASDEMEVGRQVADPDLIFPAEGHSRFGEPGLILQGDAYYLFVPLLDQQKIVGYLRLALNSEPLGVVYNRARRDFTVVALSGLGGVVILLLSLQSVLRRRTAQLVETIEQATAGRASGQALAGDEFAVVQESARRLGTQLSSLQQRATQSQQYFEAAQSITNAAMLFLNSDKTLAFANQRARDLIGYAEPGELEKRWNEVQALIEDAWETAASDGTVTRMTIDLLDTRPPRTLQLDTLDLDDDGRAGTAVRISDKTLGSAIEADLAAALQLRAIQSASPDAGAAVRGLAETMDTNLQALREALEQPAVEGDVDRLEQLTEYVDTIEDTVASLDALCKSMLAQLNQRRGLRAAFDLRDVLGDLLALAGATAERKMIKIEPHRLTTALVLAPMYRPLRDALLNLLLHIIDWMPEGTVVSTEVDRTAAQLSITLRSTAATTLSSQSWQLFEAHVLDDQGVARVGLNVVRAAVDSLGGNLDIYAAPAGGTSYRISVPLASKVPSVVPGAAASS